MRKAFSLMEVLVAVSILAVGMMAVLSLYPMGMRQFRMSRALSEIALFAEDKLSEYKTFGQLNSTKGTEANINWTVTFDDVGLDGNITLKKMNLKVEHSHFANSLKEEFVTYVE